MQRDTPATSLNLREFAATLCAQHCVARLGSQHVRATKLGKRFSEVSLRFSRNFSLDARQAQRCV